jgi:diacylglycerol O-acyltransferase
MAAERLSSLDLSFLYLEGTDTPLHLGAVMLFRQAAGVEDGNGADRLTATLRTRVAALPRLRRRLASVRLPLGAAAWVDDPGFDPAAHVHQWSLPAPGGREELAARSAELLEVPLDRARPLWELHVLGGLADGSVAVLAKIHRALADGLRAVGLGLALFDDPSDPARHGQPVPAVVSAATAPAGRFAGRLAGAVSDLLAPARAWLDPRTAPGELARHAGQAWDAAGIGVSVAQALRHPAPASPLNFTLGPARRFTMLRADLDDVHLVRQAHGGTVNEVLLTVVTGGLRSWLADRRNPLTAPLRVLVPVSRPPRDPRDPAGNRLSGYLLDLPIDEPDPLARLRAVRHAMTANKAAGPTRGAGAFPLLTDRLPPLLQRLAAPLAAPVACRLFNTVIALVPLPDVPLTLAGAPLAEIYPVVPLAPGQALGVAISTYHGTAHIGLHADHAAMPDLDQLGHGLTAALAELVDLRAVPCLLRRRSLRDGQERHRCFEKEHARVEPLPRHGARRDRTP